MQIDEDGPQASTLQPIEQVKNAPGATPHSRVLALAEATELHEHMNTLPFMAWLTFA